MWQRYCLLLLIVFFEQGAVLSLPDTKTGRRKGAAEKVVLETTLARRWLLQACQGLPPQASIPWYLPLLNRLSLPGCMQFTACDVVAPHSASFLSHGNLEKPSSSTARVICKTLSSPTWSRFDNSLTAMRGSGVRGSATNLKPKI